MQSFLHKFRKNTVNIQVYKYDGTLYRQYNKATIIEMNDEEIIVNLQGVRVVECENKEIDKKKCWHIKTKCIWVFRSNTFYNAIISLKNNTQASYYINLSSDYIFEDNTIKFIDYDYDIKVLENKNFEIVDKCDFDSNKILMQYPQHLCQALTQQSQELLKDYVLVQGIFDSKYIKKYLGLCRCRRCYKLF
ncbi:Protein of uncharacterised function (DUF402) [Mesomycoplasma conjunctivae]|uniref:RNAse G and E associated domain containing pro n=1 Tax=Mesomycoplasma conjunctivae (strain ATCC 25834 / NCTC 10147 / HRC/581) TaxID=572263 RepID=C5J6D3_MESCH|nr:DUF402 domain-containing protein [Mesomycoplasma conjunctivae]CAT05025.1 RNAse G and E associated domain containing pro [Mesomycoplasma conjunctivae]VEU66317.1 Protein of uncharacterised function (DUF402) [Mesomycoplasma conjunctivae]